MSTEPSKQSSQAVSVGLSSLVILERLNAWVSKRETTLAVLGVCLFFLLNLSIATRSPFESGMMMDETAYVDPGFNLAAGKGWISTMWPWQTDREFWSQNSPLYPAALSLWVRLFGISMVSSRAYCYLLGAVGTYFFWLATFRFKFLTSTSRLFWIVLLSTEYTTNWMMRNERYDVWIFVALGIGLFGASLRHPAGRFGLLFLGCFLGPVAGFVCIPYIFAMAVAVTFITRFSHWKEALTAMVGTGCGMAAVFIFYAMTGTLGVFLHTLKSLSAVTVKTSVWSKFQFFLYPKQDVGMVLMMAALLLLTLASRKNQQTANCRRWMLLGWGSIVLVPAIMLARASFTMMYFYMVVIPLSLSVLALLTLQMPTNRRQWLLAAGAATMLGLTCLTGLPGRIYTTLREWKFRDPQHVQNFVNAHTSTNDCVLTDYQFYFALRDRVRLCVDEYYIRAIPPDEAARINVVCLPVKDYPDLERDPSPLKSIGGGWKKVATFPTVEMQAQLAGRHSSAQMCVLYRR